MLFITAWLGSLAMALTCAFGPVGGLMNRKLGPRLTGIAGALISALGLIITSQLKHMEVMFFTYGVIFAFGSSFVYTTVFNIVPKYFLKRRSLATGLISTGPGAGLFLISQIMEVSSSAFGWRGALIVVGGMQVAMTFPILLFSPNVEDSTPVIGKCGGVWVKHAYRSPPPLWKNKPLVLYSISGSLGALGVMIPHVHMVSMTTQSKAHFVKCDVILMKSDFRFQIEKRLPVPNRKAITVKIFSF
jgi:MCP family monocarboxylic acid transporter-like MFS transporter 10